MRFRIKINNWMANEVETNGKRTLPANEKITSEPKKHRITPHDSLVKITVEQRNNDTGNCFYNSESQGENYGFGSKKRIDRIGINKYIGSRSISRAFTSPRTDYEEKKNNNHTYYRNTDGLDNDK